MGQNSQSLETFKATVHRLKSEIMALSLATKDPRMPWYAKFLAVIVVTYALSPIDLIPDFIPILGYLDDLILLPLGIALVLKLTPEDVLNDARIRARGQKRPASWLGAVIVVMIWLLLFFWILTFFRPAY